MRGVLSRFCHGRLLKEAADTSQSSRSRARSSKKVIHIGISARKSDLLITKNLRWLQELQAVHTEVSDINDLGNLLSLKKQLPELKAAGVLTQFWHS
jgi:hypothetical protein